MSLTLGLLLLAVLLLPIVRGIWLATELFRLSATHGVLRLERGRLPPALFRELSDVAERQRLHGVLLRAVLDGGRARLIVVGEAGSAVEQPLRNVLGRFTLAQLRAGTLRAK